LTNSLEWSGISKTLVFIVVSPVLGLVLGFFFMVLLAWSIRRSTPRYVDSLFRRGQLLSAALYSLGHGGNDAQKTAGIIFGILAAARMLGGTDHIPFWVLLLCHVAMGLGTAFGGWRIVKTMGMKITKLKPVGGFAAETAGATTLAINAVAGIPRVDDARDHRHGTGCGPRAANCAAASTPHRDCSCITCWRVSKL
jgi:inorganic phosphate transporter, PiT family